MDKHLDPLLKDQSLVIFRNGETPYNDRETPKAFATKFLLETIKMAELTALGMVIMQRMKDALRIPKWAIRG